MEVIRNQVNLKIKKIKVQTMGLMQGVFPKINTN